MTPFFVSVPVGWHVLAVLRNARGSDWVALAADQDPAVAHISASAWVRIDQRLHHSGQRCALLGSKVSEPKQRTRMHQAVFGLQSFQHSLPLRVERLECCTGVGELCFARSEWAGWWHNVGV